jgi:lipopolysaccharide/colanic/teichoic acid biosynthesis glycosyltransferase
MTNSIISNLQKNYYTVSREDLDQHSYCTLKWRRGQLLVRLPEHNQPYLSSLNQSESLTECLKHSPVSLVRIDPRLGEVKLRLWADACLKAGKPMFMNISSAQKLPNRGTPLLKWLKFVIEGLVAFILLFAASPLLLGLIAAMLIYSKGTLFEREWHVGERGKLFQVVKFRTTDVTIRTNFSEREGEENVTPIGSWMRKYGLDNLPQLLNVLRGEMHLTGRRSWKLEDAIRLNAEGQRLLNKTPGLASSWQVEPEASLLHLDSQIL